MVKSRSTRWVSHLFSLEICVFYTNSQFSSIQKTPKVRRKTQELDHITKITMHRHPKAHYLVCKTLISLNSFNCFKMRLLFCYMKVHCLAYRISDQKKTLRKTGSAIEQENRPKKTSDLKKNSQEQQEFGRKNLKHTKSSSSDKHTNGSQTGGNHKFITLFIFCTYLFI